MKKRKIFTLADFKAMLDTATNIKTVRAVLAIADDLLQSNDISPYLYAGVLREASSKIYSITNH